MPGELIAIRVQDIKRDLWFNWDIGVWDSIPTVTAGENNLYIAMWAVNRGFVGSTIRLELVDDIGRTLAVKEEFVGIGGGIGLEWTGNMPHRHYFVNCLVDGWAQVISITAIDSIPQPTTWIYPVDDDWCEFVTSENGTLKHIDGYWWVWFYGAGYALGVNTTDYKVGALSIEVACKGSPYTLNSFELVNHFDKALNLMNAVLLEFWLYPTKVGPNDCGFVNEFTVKLISENGMVARRSYNPENMVEAWQHFSTKAGPDAVTDWIIDKGFDWAKIKELRFYWEQAQGSIWGAPTQYMRIDGLFFYFALNVSIIRVESNPFSAVPFSLDGQEFTTPWVGEVEPPGIYTVTIANTIDSWTFDHWDDGSITPGRTVDASEPGIYKLTAFYKSPTPTPTPTPTFRWQPGYFINYVLGLLRKRKLLSTY